MKWLALALMLAACAGEPAVRVVANPERQAWQQRLNSLVPNVPLELRYNPAACNCPAFELQLDGQWLRAELPIDDPAWLAWLSALPPESWPVPVQAHGRVSRQLYRTQAGLYAVRIEALKVVSPLVPSPVPPSPVP